MPAFWKTEKLALKQKTALVNFLRMRIHHRGAEFAEALFKIISFFDVLGVLSVSAVQSPSPCLATGKAEAQ